MVSFSHCQEPTSSTHIDFVKDHIQYSLKILCNLQVCHVLTVLMMFLRESTSHISVLLMFIFTEGVVCTRWFYLGVSLSDFLKKNAWSTFIILGYMIPILTLPPKRWGRKLSGQLLADLFQTCLSLAQVSQTVIRCGRTSDSPPTAGGLLGQVVPQQTFKSSIIRFSSQGNNNWDHEKMMTFCWMWPLFK